MSEEQTNQILPAPPVTFQIAPALIENWVKLPTAHPLNVSLTKQDIDNLFFAVTNLAGAIASLQQTVIHQSHGRTPEANSALADSQRKNVEGENYIRMFLNSLMASVQSHG